MVALGTKDLFFFLRSLYSSQKMVAFRIEDVFSEVHPQREDIAPKIFACHTENFVLDISLTQSNT